MSININPEAVHEAAKGVDDAVASALDDVKNCLAPSADAASANPGWRSAAALVACRQTWSDHLNDVVKRTGEAAEKLRASAKDYQDAERRIVEALEDVRWESE
ncbi:hypothetical protein ACWEIJ_42165 [Lentzea sp. NPDC004789]